MVLNFESMTHVELSTCAGHTRNEGTPVLGCILCGEFMSGVTSIDYSNQNQLPDQHSNH